MIRATREGLAAECRAVYLALDEILRGTDAHAWPVSRRALVVAAGDMEQAYVRLAAITREKPSASAVPYTAELTQVDSAVAAARVTLDVDDDRAREIAALLDPILDAVRRARVALASGARGEASVERAALDLEIWRG